MANESLTKEIIFNELKRNSSVLDRLGVSRIGLFGSFVRSEQHKTSDIDFIVEFLPEQKKYKNFIQLAFFLEELFNHKVDLLTDKSVSPYIKPHIENEIEYAPLGH